MVECEFEKLVARATTKILAGYVSFDDRNEWDAANNRWLCQLDGRIRVDAQVRFAAKTTAKLLTLAIFKNGSMVKSFGTLAAETADVMQSVCDAVGVRCPSLLETIST